MYCLVYLQIAKRAQLFSLGIVSALVGHPMEVGDPGGQQRLSTLLSRICEKTSPALDAALLSGIKALCKQDDGDVALAWEALWGHLQAPHTQVGGRRHSPPSPPVPAKGCHFRQHLSGCSLTWLYLYHWAPCNPATCRHASWHCWCASSCSAAAEPSAKRS